MKLRLLSALVVLLGMVPVLAGGAEFRRERGHISMTGRVEAQDFDKFRKFLQDPEVLIDLMQGAMALDSPGGDVNAALQIGSLLHLAHATVLVKKDSICFSSCFLIFSGGSYRLIASTGTLGVHRLRFSQPATMHATEKMLADLGGSIENYLRSAGIPERVIEKARETPPSELFRINLRWLAERDLRLDYRPAFIDVVSRDCGSEPLNAGREAGQAAWIDCMEKVRWKEQQRNTPRIMEIIIKGR